MRMEIPSHPCALLLFKERIIDTISFSEKEIFSILLLVLYSNGGNVLLLLIRVHWSAKNVLNKVIFSYIFVTNVPFRKIVGIRGDKG